MIVADASVIVQALIDAGADGVACRAAIRPEQLAAPDLMRVEVMSVIRREFLAGRLTNQQAAAAIDDLQDLPILIYPTAPLLRRGWQLRSNVTSYDACYVVLAEALGCRLLTSDARLAHAPGLRCAVDITPAPV